MSTESEQADILTSIILMGQENLRKRLELMVNEMVQSKLEKSDIEIIDVSKTDELDVFNIKVKIHT